MKYVVSIRALPVRVGGWWCKACQDGLGYFFPTFAWGFKGLPEWFGALFSHVCLGVQGLARMVWGIFFPRLPGGVKACQDGLGHFFHVCPFDRGGVGLKLFGQCPYRTNTFQKGASHLRGYLRLTQASKFEPLRQIDLSGRRSPSCGEQHDY